MILQSRAQSKRGFSRAPVAATAGVWLLAAAVLRGAPEDWTQWGRNAQHTGAASVLGQPLQAILADVVYDPFVEAEKAFGGDELLAHYAVPLLEGDSVYMAFASGSLPDFTEWDTIVWSVKRLRWQGAALTEAWSFESDWKPLAWGRAQWLPPFQSALAGDILYVPGAGGTLFAVSKSSGRQLARINPFDQIDPERRVAGGVAVASDGSAYYNVVSLTADLSLTDAWLVHAFPDGSATRSDYAALTPNAPAASDPCEFVFHSNDAPFPPSPTAVPDTIPCGAQRPGFNVVPAIGPDGTVYTVSVAHINPRYAYLIAVAPDLTLRWDASLRGILDDGCGVLLPRDDLSCRDNANIGVDPHTNNRPAGEVSDFGTSSPVVLPDGNVLIGASTDYNYGRGHLFEFDPTGSALATYDFGWDITPAVFAHDGTYSIRIKNNYYGGPPGTEGRYEISSLDAHLVPEWSVASTQTQDCVRQLDDTVVCMDDGFHPDGFEWCVNQPAVDAAGVTYANSEDGSLYAIGPDGTPGGEIFLSSALGAAYTPVSIGPDGVVYAQNNGHLFAVGARRAPRDGPTPPDSPPPATRTVAR